MRHGNKINHLGRKTAHRKALLMNLSNALIAHKRITTTVAKAKELRKHIEPLLNKCKTDTTHNRRILFSYLSDKESIKELFGVIADKIATRPGGYTRIIKLGFRKGDAADIAMIELVDFNEVYKNKSNVDSGKKKSRRGRGGKTSSSEGAVVADQEALIDDAVIVENIDSSLEELAIEEVSVSNEAASSEELAVEEIEETIVSNDANAEEDVVEEVVTEVAVEETTQAVDEHSSGETAAVDGNNETQDDLKIIEGIGPKIEELLHEKGITTFAQVAETPAENIKTILTEAGSSFATHDPGTWAEQAALLRDGKMDQFNTLAEELKGGKRVD